MSVPSRSTFSSTFVGRGFNSAAVAVAVAVAAAVGSAFSYGRSCQPHRFTFKHFALDDAFSTSVLSYLR
jgi:hypothetical protein